MASTLWLSLCLLLFVHNLMDLLSDRYLLSYKIVEKGDAFFDEVHDLNYLACTPFKLIKDLDLSTTESSTQNVSVRSFLIYSIASIEHRLNVTGLFRLNESFIFNEHVCFPTTKSELEKGQEEKPFNNNNNEFLEVYGIQAIFIYSKEKQPNFYERAYQKNDGMPSIYLRAYKQKVFGENHLLNAHCSNRTQQIHHDRFSCLNRCLVQLKIKSALYRFDDEGLIFGLSKVLKEKQIGKREADNKEALKDFKKLATLNTTEGAEDCPEKGCFWEVVINLKIDYRYYRDYLQEEGKDKVDLQLNTYTAFYSMDDFCLQLFGLLALFTGTSVLRLLHALLSLALPVATRKIEPLLKNEKLLRIFRLVLPNLKHALTLLCLVLVLVQGLAMVNEFRFQSSHPNRTSTLNVSSEPFSVVICLSFLELEEDLPLLRNLSLHSIEEDTKSLLLERTEDIEIYSGDKQVEANLHISGEVLFKSSEFDGQRWLSRCFRLNLDLDDTLRKMSLTYLRIEFKTTDREIFLIEKNQNFTSGLVNFRGLFYPQKVTKRHSKTSKKSNCRDYSNEEGCDSSRNCLDLCLSTKFIEKHGSLPTNTVVSSNHLNSTMRNRSVYFNETVDVEVQKECSDLFNQTDCNEVLFEESPELVNSEVTIPKLIFIRLSYLNIVEREMEHDPVKTLLDIVGLETIFFGSNAIGMLTTVLLFLCRSLRLKWRRAYSMFLFLLASAGFLAHNVLVFRTIINGDLQENEFFEKPQQYSLPSPILCFPIGKEMDENHRVSEEYLDDLTAEMTFKNVFRGIVYNNRTYLKQLYINRLNSTKSSTFYSSPELELSHFYFSGLKCFKIHLKVSYREKDFFFLTDKTVLSIYLKHSFANKMRQTTFLHQQADSEEIGGGFLYDIGECKYPYNHHYRYDIEFELFKILRNDQFELLKEPGRLFRRRAQVNDAETWEDLNRTTDQSTSESLDFEQNVANTYTNVYYSPFKFNSPHFWFSFSFLVRRVVITNRENYTKLVVSLLNTLSLWLDISLIDMGSWLSSIFKLFLNFYRLLIKISNRLDHLRLKLRE